MGRAAVNVISLLRPRSVVLCARCVKQATRGVAPFDDAAGDVTREGRTAILAGIVIVGFQSDVQKDQNAVVVFDGELLHGYSKVIRCGLTKEDGCSRSILLTNSVGLD